jgi:tetratricopeptide (TPR) repeat protein
LGLPLAVTAAQFWEIRDYYWESRQWIDRMLAKTDIGQEGGAMPEGRDTAVLKARALYFLGSSSIYLGEYETGRQRLEESLARYRMLDDRSSLILVLSVLGGYLATNAGQPAAAIPHLREAVNLARAAGPPYRLAKALRELAWALHLVGESEGGLDLLQEAIAPLRELGDEGRLGPVYQVLGAIALAIGQRRRSEEWFLDGLPRSARAKDRAYVALQLEGLAQIAAEDEQWERAARLWGAVEGLRTTIRFPIAPADWPRYERWVPKIGEHLGRADWDRLSQEGREMSVEEMVVYALRTGATLSG